MKAWNNIKFFSVLKLSTQTRLQSWLNLFALLNWSLNNNADLPTLLAGMIKHIEKAVREQNISMNNKATE